MRDEAFSPSIKTASRRLVACSVAVKGIQATFSLNNIRYQGCLVRCAGQSKRGQPIG